MSQYEKREPSSRRRSEAADRERVRKVQQAARGASASRGRSSSSSGRSSSSSSAGRRTSSARNRRRRRRGGGLDIVKVLIAAGAMVILVLLLAIGIKSCGSSDSTLVSGETTEGETTSEPESELEKEITVGGVSISGLTHTQARDAILESMNWDMKVSYNGEEMSVDNLVTEPLETLLSSIYSGQSKEETYALDSLDVTDAAVTTAKAAADLWNVKAINAGIGEYNVSTSRFSFVGGQNGTAIEEEKLASAIQEAVKGGEYQAVISATAVETTPEVSIDQAKEMYETIGTYTTKTTSNKDRNTNISLAAAALNGKILKPGETFSMNSATGERTYEKGYRPAGAYVNGELVLEPGGGVCQVSSTLYNAVIFAGLKTTERYAHSYEPSYVTPGEDAMISYPGLDMKFVNNTEYSVGIKALFSNQTLTVNIVGVSNLEDGVKISMESEKVSDVEPPEPNYVEDTTLQPGEEVVVKKAEKGSKWVTYLVTTKNGEVVSRELFHNSTYKPKAATIKRNTSGEVTESNSAVEPTEAPSIQDGTLDTVLPGGEGSTGVNTDQKPEETTKSSEEKETETSKKETSSSSEATTKAEETEKQTESQPTESESEVQPVSPSKPANSSEPVSPGGSSSQESQPIVTPNPDGGSGNSSNIPIIDPNGPSGN